MSKLIVKAALIVVFAAVLIYGIDALSIIVARYFNNRTAIQFLEWLYWV